MLSFVSTWDSFNLKILSYQTMDSHYKHKSLIFVIGIPIPEKQNGLSFLKCPSSVFQAKKTSDEIFSASTDKEIHAEADRLDIVDKAPLLLVEILLDDHTLTQIKKLRPHFLRVCWHCCCWRLGWECLGWNSKKINTCDENWQYILCNSTVKVHRTCQLSACF